jgi:hypothetical protein
VTLVKDRFFRKQVALLLLFCSIIVFSVSLFSANKGFVKIPDNLGGIGELLPDLTVFDSGSKPFHLQNLKGKPYLVALLFLYEPSTRAQLIILESLRATHPDTELGICGISMHRNAVLYLNNYLSNRPVAFTMYASPHGTELAFGGFSSRPLILLTNSEGIVQKRLEGYRSLEVLEDEISQITQLHK